jgi:hypothetical protein
VEEALRWQKTPADDLLELSHDTPVQGFLSGGGGEMGERIRAFDWASTPLGPMETWSPALRTMLPTLILHQANPGREWGFHPNLELSSDVKNVEALQRERGNRAEGASGLT